MAYSNDGHIMCTYSINGRLLKMINTGERLFTMCLSGDGNVLLTGGERCLVVLRYVNNLRLANTGARSQLDAVIDGYEDGLVNEWSLEPMNSPIR